MKRYTPSQVLRILKAKGLSATPEELKQVTSQLNNELFFQEIEEPVRREKTLMEKRKKRKIR